MFVNGICIDILLQIWTTLKEGITQIYKREPSLTMAQYMDLYT